MTENMYEPPKADLGSPQEEGPLPEFWNPNSAGIWSIFFTPIFGSFFLLKNWQDIGDAVQVSKLKKWLALSCVVVIPSFMVPGMSVVYLIAWYFLAQRPQALYVKEHWGDRYIRKKWGKVVRNVSLVGAAVSAVFLLVILGLSGSA